MKYIPYTSTLKAQINAAKKKERKKQEKENRYDTRKKNL